MTIAMVALAQPGRIAGDKRDFNAMVTELGQFSIRWSPEAELIFQHVVQMDLTLSVVGLKQFPGKSNSCGTSATNQGAQLRVLQDIRFVGSVSILKLVCCVCSISLLSFQLSAFFTYGFNVAQVNPAVLMFPPF